MEKSKLLREIATAMVEFKLKKEFSAPLIGSNVSLCYRYPNSNQMISILSDVAINDLTENLLDITFEIEVIVPVQKQLYELFYGPYHSLSNTISRAIYLEGDCFVEKVKLLMQTTNVNASDATKILLETMHSESVIRAVKLLEEIKQKANANQDQ